MILTYKQLRQINTNQTLMQKLMLTPMPLKLSYNLKKMLDKLSDAGKLVHEAHLKFLVEIEHLAAKNASGEIVRHPGGGFDIAEEHQEAYRKAISEFELRTVTVDRFPIQLALLEEAPQLQLTIAELSAMEPILADLDVIPGGAPDRGALPQGPTQDPPPAA